MSIIMASGTPDWSKVVIPPGRTEKACYHIYNQVKQSASQYANGAGGTPQKRKRRAPKKKDNGAMDEKPLDDGEAEIHDNSKKRKVQKQPDRESDMVFELDENTIKKEVKEEEEDGEEDDGGRND